MQCKVCFECYDDGHRIPLVYSCGHTYCLECCEAWHKNDKYTCPTCRYTQSKSPPTNFILLELLMHVLSPSVKKVIQVIENGDEHDYDKLTKQREEIVKIEKELMQEHIKSNQLNDRYIDMHQRWWYLLQNQRELGMDHSHKQLYQFLCESKEYERQILRQIDINGLITSKNDHIVQLIRNKLIEQHTRILLIRQNRDDSDTYYSKIIEWTKEKCTQKLFKLNGKNYEEVNILDQINTMCKQQDAIRKNTIRCRSIHSFKKSSEKNADEDIDSLLDEIHGIEKEKYVPILYPDSESIHNGRERATQHISDTYK